MQPRAKLTMASLPSGLGRYEQSGQSTRSQAGWNWSRSKQSIRAAFVTGTPSLR